MKRRDFSNENHHSHHRHARRRAAYIALSLGLVKAGHTVTLATHPCMRGLVESYGVEFAPMGPDIDIGYEAAMIRANAPHWVVGFQRVMKFSFAMLEQSHASLLETCRGRDLVIVSHSAAGRMEADKLGLPTVSVTLMAEAIPAKDPNDSFLKRTLMNLCFWQAKSVPFGRRKCHPFLQKKTHVQPFVKFFWFFSYKKSTPSGEHSAREPRFCRLLASQKPEKRVVQAEPEADAHAFSFCRVCGEKGRPKSGVVY